MGNALGPYISLQDLINLRFGAPTLDLKPRRAVAGQAGGSYQTRLRGRGLEFVEVRPYQAGDDIRTIDWRVTARSSKPHTRLYTEERERPVILFCDQRSSMFFGTKDRFKSVQAAALTALLGWAAHNHGDRVGGLVLGDAELAALRPKGSSRHVLQLLKSVDEYNNQLNPNEDNNDAVSLADALAEIRRIAHPGTAVFLLSDFHDLDDNALTQLFQTSRHCDVNALCVYDPLEAELPPSGYFRVTSRGETASINTSRKRNREDYQSAFSHQQQMVAEACGRIGVNYASVSTADDPVSFISNYLRPGRPRR